MPLAKKTSSLPSDFLDQMVRNFEVEKKEPPKDISSDTPSPDMNARNGKQSRYSDVVNLSLSHGKRMVFKAFFAQHDLNMTAGFEMAVDFLMKEVAAGNLALSKSGVDKISDGR